MRKLFICLVILASPGFLFAQLNSFDLSTYKLPDISRHQLDLNVDLNGSSKMYDQNYSVNPDNYTLSNNISGNLDVSYSYYKNNQKFQSSQLYRIDFSPSFNDQKDADNLQFEYYELSSNIYLYSVNRFYFNSVVFFETDLNIDGGIRKSNENSFSDIEEYDQKNINVSIPLLVGFGRIEQVQDSRLAIYIIDELNNQGKLTRVPNQDEIIEFSELISRLKNERFFDSRLQKIHEIEEVDSYLQTNGFINVADSKYFTIVNDNWDYASTPIRESGYRISFGIIPELYSTYSKTQLKNGISTAVNEFEKNRYGIGLCFKYKYEKPINLFWQSSLSFNLTGKYINGNIYDFPYNTSIESPQLNSSLSYSLGFYPNSRTDLSLSVYLNFFNAFGQETINTVENNINHLEISPYSSLNLNYYISPKIKLNVNYSINYRYTESDSQYYQYIYNDYLKDKTFNQRINIGFVYQIF